MGLDIRWPIGLLFSLVGAMMVVWGFMTNSDTELYKRSLGINVNLYWGLVLLVFGGSMLMLAWRGSKKVQPPETQEKPAKPEQELTGRR
jgi:hypothetical protein